jgi:hypothetical protein
MCMRAQGVTPEKVPQKFSNFWRKDVKAHRNYYRSKEIKLIKDDAKAFGLKGYLLRMALLLCLFEGLLPS